MKVPLTSECLRSQVNHFVLSCHYSLTCLVFLIHFSVAKFKRCLSLLPPFFLHLHLAQPWPLRQNHFTRGMKRRFASTTNFSTRRKCLTLSPWTQTIRRVRTSIRCTTKVGRIRMLRFSYSQYRIFCVCISIFKFCASSVESSHTFWSCNVYVLLFSIFKSITLLLSGIFT